MKTVKGTKRLKRAKTTPLRILIVGVTLGALGTPRSTQAAPRVALVGGTVHDGNGAVIEHAVVEFEDERLIKVGAGSPSSGATVVDVAGKWITPGLIAAHTHVGLVEISMEAGTNDSARGEDEIQAAHDAALAVHANSSLLRVQAIDGVTSAAVTPRGGLLSGQVAWIDLLAGHHTELVVQPRIAQAGALGQTYWGSRAATITRLRQLLDDARFYANNRNRFDRGQSRELAAGLLELRALDPVARGTVPLILRAHRASDLLAIVELARETDVRPVVVGGTQAWQVADALAAAQIPVIVQPTANLPTSLSRIGARFDLAAQLHQAGVEVGIAVLDEAHNVRNVTQEAGIAVANGLPAEVALAAITSVLARAYDMDRETGSLEVGKVANVVVWPGDPFELSNVPEAVYIRGAALELRSRQTQLRDRYLPARKASP